jgi:hypothetical protein
MGTTILCLLFLAGASLNADDKYDGPVPPKPDLPYLLHAKTLVETEVGQAREERRKNESTYIVGGENSTARTPMAEPIFIIKVSQIAPDRMELYRLEVKNGNREVSLSTKTQKGSSPPLHLRVTPLADHLYKVEASEPLENGEYALSPSGENRVFCFEVY